MDQANYTSTTFDIPPELLRSVRIIYAAATMGVTFLGAISVFLYFNGTQSQAAPLGDLKFIDMINWILIALALFGFWMGEQLFRRLLAKRIPAHVTQSDAEAWQLQKVRSAVVTKVVLYEMMASLGWFAFLLTVFQGAIYTNGVYWLDTLPYIVFVYIVVNSWPTAERLHAWLQIARHHSLQV